MTQGPPRTFDYDEVVRLFGDGLTYREISERLGISKASVSTALRMPRRLSIPRRKPGLPPHSVDSFWERTAIGDPDECWEWMGSRRPQGYGHFGGGLYAHRVAYTLAHGPIPEGLWVLHSCDNPPCVNPSHLSLGDAKENTRQMIERGRSAGPIPGSPSHLAHAANTCLRGHDSDIYGRRLKSGPNAGTQIACRACEAERRAADPERRERELATRRVASRRRAAKKKAEREAAAQLGGTTWV